MSLSLFGTSWRELWAGRFDAESTGAIFTRSEVVDLILDLSGYRVEKGLRLATLRLLEPSCGDGAFVSRVVARLIESERLATDGQFDWSWNILDSSVTASDINPQHISDARALVIDQLEAAGCPVSRARQLAELWVVEADFLLYPWANRFHVVVGNPPYVRIESLPGEVLAAYRDSYDTMGDRSDVYVAFIERGLSLLTDDGRLCYIVANRWAKNLYGRSLRALISEKYHVSAYLDLAHTSPFVQDVSAYPCIVLLDREQGAPTHAATLEDIDPATLDAVRHAVVSASPVKGRKRVKYPAPAPKTMLVREFASWYQNGAPWITTSVDDHARLEHMSRELPILEDSAPGTKVGIGVATGADKVFILREYSEAIEPDRQLKLAMPGDPKNHATEWTGHWLVNPFASEGGLVDLKEYPGLAKHFEQFVGQLKGRHVAKGKPTGWFRTIDRIWPELASRDKLLIRDIQDPAKPTIGFDAPGRYYPHHNLYWLVSAEWPLRALQCLLRSERVVSQVQAHSVAMRGGSIRWQAQVLRKLRVPALKDIPDELLERMAHAGGGEDRALIDALATEAYARAGA